MAANSVHRKRDPTLEGGRPAPDVVQSSAIQVTVKEKGAFLDALGKAGFSINSVRDKLVAFYQGDENHPFDNAREITKWAKDPEMHFANDKSNDPRYGPNWFFFHWDRTSSHTQLSGLGEEKVAGEKHKLGNASPERVLEYLKRERKAPQ